MPVVTAANIGPLTGSATTDCTSGSTPAAVSALASKMGSAAPNWSAIRTLALAASSPAIGCCAYAETVNTWLFQPGTTTSRDEAYDQFDDFRAASCGGATLLTSDGAL